MLEIGASLDGLVENANVLDYAINDGNTLMAKLYIEKGADVNLKSPDGFTPLMRAVSVYGLTNNKKMIELLLNHGARVNETAAGGQSALSFAAANRFKGIVTLLKEHGAIETELTSMMMRLMNRF